MNLLNASLSSLPEPGGLYAVINIQPAMTFRDTKQDNAHPPSSLDTCNQSQNLFKAGSGSEVRSMPHVAYSVLYPERT